MLCAIYSTTIYSNLFFIKGIQYIIYSNDYSEPLNQSTVLKFNGFMEKLALNTLQFKKYRYLLKFSFDFFSKSASSEFDIEERLPAANLSKRQTSTELTIDTITVTKLTLQVKREQYSMLAI